MKQESVSWKNHIKDKIGNLTIYLEGKDLTHTDRVCSKKDLDDYIVRAKQEGIIELNSEEREYVSVGQIPPHWI